MCNLQNGLADSRFVSFYTNATAYDMKPSNPNATVLLHPRQDMQCILTIQ